MSAQPGQARHALPIPAGPADCCGRVIIVALPPSVLRRASSWLKGRGEGVGELREVDGSQAACGQAPEAVAVDFDPRYPCVEPAPLRRWIDHGAKVVGFAGSCCGERAYSRVKEALRRGRLQLISKRAGFAAGSYGRCERASRSLVKSRREASPWKVRRADLSRGPSSTTSLEETDE